MYAGKTLFAQLMDYLPWTTFTRIVDRYDGNHPAIRGPALTYTGDAFLEGLEKTMHYEPDAIIAMADGIFDNNW
jgi:hypothetical protein